MKNKTHYYVLLANKSAIRCFTTPRDVYDYLCENAIGHDDAADAESWCEIPEGDHYEHDKFYVVLQEG